MTLLAIELGSLNPEPYIPIITQALQTVESHLYVVVFLSPELVPKLNSPAKRAGQWQPLQQLISTLYVSTASKPDVFCDIIFADWCGYQLEDEVWEYSVLNIPECMGPLLEGLMKASPEIVTRLPKSSLSVRTVTYLNDPSITEETTPYPSTEKDHAVVAVGGTFDHLHPGHKILLSLTAYLSSRKLICGITDDALLKNKKFAQVLESISVRTENVRKFLTLIARNLALELVPIQDVYGPTAYDPEISGLVISEETRAGAQSIAELRKEQGLQTLDVFVIDVIGDAGGKVGVEKMAEEKMSSTKIRERLVQKQ